MPSGTWTGVGRHRRGDDETQVAVSRYRQLVWALHHHRPGERSGLCAVCGVGWPCLEVLSPIRRDGAHRG
jgi:hypothetical protein